LLRALEAEAEALQKIHVRIQKQLRNLEVEEQIIQRMISRQEHQLMLEQQYQQEEAGLVLAEQYPPAMEPPTSEQPEPLPEAAAVHGNCSRPAANHSHATAQGAHGYMQLPSFPQPGGHGHLSPAELGS